MVDVLDARKLRMLAELERLGTLAAVARRLHLTAPGVSMQLAALEKEVGVQLTERRGRVLALTPAGLLLAQHGHDLVDRLLLAEMELTALRDGAVGTYRIAAFPSAARTIVADTWASVLGSAHVGLTLEVIEMEPQNAVPALARGDVHLAISHTYSNMPKSTYAGLLSTPLFEEPVWLAVPSSDPARPLGDTTPPCVERVRLAAYAEQPWVVPHRQWTCHDMVQHACGLAGFSPRIVAEATDFAVILALVAAGAGVALIPDLAVDRVPAGVTLHPLAVPVSRVAAVLTRASMHADPGIHRVRELLQESARRRSLIAVPAGE